MTMEKQFYTYLHCKPNGDPFYVGKGCGRRAHDFNQRSEYHKNVVSKYGRENIHIFIFECASENQAFRDEIQQISQFKKEGYKLINLTDGGEGPSGYVPTIEHRLIVAESNRKRICSDETRKKLIEKNLGNTYNLGKTRSEETKQKLSQASSGKTQSEESKQKISIANKGNKYCLGRQYSEETLEKMSLAKKGKPQRKVACPHCDKIGGVSMMTLLHFDNCKRKSFNVT